MISVAIDGPAGAGKSTIARAAAKSLSFIYVDTGALYRSIGYYLLSKGLDPAKPEDVIPCLDEINLSLRYGGDGEQQVILNGEDVSGKIRTPEVSMAASGVSAIPRVREFLLELQRSMAKTQNVIMDGRDIGTVVLPDADVKIFLTAAPEARARRRYDEMTAKGIQTTYEEVLADVNRRDYQDSHRAAAPLKQAEDAVLADTTSLTLEESIDLIRSIIEEKGGVR